MSVETRKKLKLLYIMKILLEKSDECHHLTVNEIISQLKIYDISAERKSVYSDINALSDFGLDIICEKGRANEYFIVNRDFELPELKLLVDVVQVSKFITHKKSIELIKKLEKLTSIYEAKELHRYVLVDDRIKITNEKIYYNVDKIYSAIRQNKRVEFKYYSYNVDKKKVYKREGEVYCVSPYALMWSDENYYMMAYHDRYDAISNFRVDRMTEIEVSNEDRRVYPEAATLNVVDQSNKLFRMFVGETTKVTMKVDNSLINVIIDRFGKDVLIHGKSENDFKITVEIVKSETFYGWVLMFGSKIKIIEPVEVQDSFKDYIKSVMKVYGE